MTSEPVSRPRNDPSVAVYTGLVRNPKKQRRWPKIVGRVVFAVIAAASITAASFFSFTSVSTGHDPRS